MQAAEQRLQQRHDEQRAAAAELAGVRRDAAAESAAAEQAKAVQERLQATAEALRRKAQAAGDAAAAAQVKQFAKYEPVQLHGIRQRAFDLALTQTAQTAALHHAHGCCLVLPAKRQEHLQDRLPWLLDPMQAVTLERRQHVAEAEWQLEGAAADAKALAAETAALEAAQVAADRDTQVKCVVKLLQSNVLDALLKALVAETAALEATQVAAGRDDPEAPECCWIALQCLNRERKAQMRCLPLRSGAPGIPSNTIVAAPACLSRPRGQQKLPPPAGGPSGAAGAASGAVSGAARRSTIGRRGHCGAGAHEQSGGGARGADGFSGTTGAGDCGDRGAKLR